MINSFLHKYYTDPEFKDFIDAANQEEVLMEFAYSLYRKFGKDTIKEAYTVVNHDLLDIDRVIQYFEKSGEFEKCQQLLEIKKTF